MFRKNNPSLNDQTVPDVTVIELEEKSSNKFDPLSEEMAKEKRFERQLDEVVTKSILSDKDAVKQAENILREFNKIRDEKNQESAVTSSRVRGKRVGRDEFVLAHRNEIPELAAYNKRLVARHIPWLGSGQITQIIRKVKQVENYYGAFGSHVVNVPVGHYLKAWSSNNKPLLLGEGPHVIHDPTFKLCDEGNWFINIVNKLNPYISHGTKHIIRVNPGQVAKIWIGTEPFVLGYRPEPYVFEDTLFKTANDLFEDVSTSHIEHGPIHILRVPKGKIAKIKLGTTPFLLGSEGSEEIKNCPGYVSQNPTEGIYRFNAQVFELISTNQGEDFEDAYSPYIEHYTIHQLRVPAGKIAKAWLGSKSFLLDANGLIVPEGVDPNALMSELKDLEMPSPGFYKCNSPYFKLDKVVNNHGQVIDLFENAASKMIIHGSLKRVIPDTSEVAIAYDNGNLKVLGPKPNGEPYLIDSKTYRVDGFLNTSIQTVVFPSETAKRQRREENKDTPVDEINYEVFTTKDSLKIGVKLLVAYEIKEPAKTLQRLGRIEDINKHIENVTTADMGKVIQQHTAQDFLSYNHTTPKKVADAELKQMDLITHAPPTGEPKQIQDSVKLELDRDLKEYGISLVRLNFETPKILNSEIGQQMAQQALRTATAYSEKASIDIETEVAKKKADKDASVKRIEQEQVNQNAIRTAQAKAQAAEEEAKAIRTKAQAEADAKVMIAKADAEAIIIQARAAKEAKELQASAEKTAKMALGDAYKDSIDVRNVDIIQSLAASFKDAHPNINFTLLPEEFGKVAGLGNLLNTGLALFSTRPTLASQQQAEIKSMHNKVG